MSEKIDPGQEEKPGNYPYYDVEHKEVSADGDFFRRSYEDVEKDLQPLLTTIQSLDVEKGMRVALAVLFEQVDTEDYDQVLVARTKAEACHALGARLRKRKALDYRQGYSSDFMNIQQIVGNRVDGYAPKSLTELVNEVALRSSKDRIIGAPTPDINSIRYNIERQIAAELLELLDPEDLPRPYDRVGRREIS